MNDEYCPKHEQWFGPQPCSECRAEQERMRVAMSAAYTAYIERGGRLEFEQWRDRWMGDTVRLVAELHRNPELYDVCERFRSYLPEEVGKAIATLPDFEAAVGRRRWEAGRGQ